MSQLYLKTINCLLGKALSILGILKLGLKVVEKETKLASALHCFGSLCSRKGRLVEVF